MKQAEYTLSIRTQGQGLYELTNDVLNWVSAQALNSGLLTVYCAHTSASLTIQENADPDVQHDLKIFFSRLVQEDTMLYRHTCEGPDDMPAHIKSALTDVSLSIPVSNARPVLGIWQGIYLFEHRNHSHNRNITLQLMGS
jgi:secondary thiamine-phosphate synthase enzyme